MLPKHEHKYIILQKNIIHEIIVIPSLHFSPKLIYKILGTI